ncbi:MAG: hypothetical protein K2O70_05385 [Desulfovibrionaceae bacterium]|nr:hypothetical protein [Desulfovibrionaceae bacterium]
MSDYHAELSDLKRHIVATAILREAARLADRNSTNPNEITPKKIQQAVKEYKEILEEMKKHIL